MSDRIKTALPARERNIETAGTELDLCEEERENV